jgi:hypothetical protein
MAAQRESSGALGCERTHDHPRKEQAMTAFVWAAKVPGRLSFNTDPMPESEAMEYALAVTRDQGREARVYRAAAGRNFVTSDELLRITPGR